MVFISEMCFNLIAIVQVLAQYAQVTEWWHKAYLTIYQVANKHTTQRVPMTVLTKLSASVLLWCCCCSYYHDRLCCLFQSSSNRSRHHVTILCTANESSVFVVFLWAFWGLTHFVFIWLVINTFWTIALWFVLNTHLTLQVDQLIQWIILIDSTQLDTDVIKIFKSYMQLSLSK